MFTACMGWRKSWLADAMKLDLATLAAIEASRSVARSEVAPEKWSS